MLRRWLELDPKDHLQELFIIRAIEILLLIKIELADLQRALDLKQAQIVIPAFAESINLRNRDFLVSVLGNCVVEEDLVERGLVLLTEDVLA